MELELDVKSVTVLPRNRDTTTITIIAELDSVLEALKESADRAEIAEYFGFDDPEADDE